MSGQPEKKNNNSDTTKIVACILHITIIRCSQFSKKQMKRGREISTGKLPRDAGEVASLGQGFWGIIPGKKSLPKLGETN